MKSSVKFLLIGAAAALLLLMGTAYAIIVSGVINPRADEPIHPLERWAAKTSLRAYLTRNTPATVNPLKPTSADLKAGAKLYIHNCAFCHGYANSSTSKTANGLYRQPPVFANDDLSEDPDGKVYWFIDHGVKLTAMPAYNKTLKEREIWQLVLFIKNLKNLPPDVESYWTTAAAHPVIDQ